ncbi:type VI secretion system protein TssL, short form [Pseudomonas putida]
MTANQRNTARGTPDIDALLQDTYLLVVELRQCASTQPSPELWDHCVKQVEYVRSALVGAGMAPRSIDYISHAQCALLDETVLGCASPEDHAAWARETLQARFFNSHQAGEFLYEDMRTVLREPVADLHVLTAFQRVLMLGFLGRYRDINDPERQQLIAAFATQVAPFDVTAPLITQAGRGTPRHAWRWLHSPVLHVVAAGLLLAGVWWGLDRTLSGAVASLLPGQV